MTHALRRESIRCMAGRSYKYRCAGFSLFELAISLTIIGLLGAFLSERMLRYQEYAEKTAMEVTVRNLQTGLRWQVADLMMGDRLDEVDRLLQDNPISWLESPPPNYIGERADGRQSDAVRGNWYFDTLRKELVYTPFHRNYFRPQLNGNYAVRYRIASVPVLPGNGMRPIEGLSLELLSPYKWEIQLEWSGI